MAAQGSLLAVALVVAIAAPARADDGRLLGDDTFAVHSNGGLLVDGGLVVGMPAALPAGMSIGAGAGVTRECSCWWAYGARVSWSQITEYGVDPAAWTVTQQDLRLRATGALRHRFGRGTLALRLGLGTTIVREHRVRDQAMRVPPMPSFSSHATAALPAGELEGVVALHVAGPWLLVASGGPSADYLDGKLHGGWTALVGIGWQP